MIKQGGKFMEITEKMNNIIAFDLGGTSLKYGFGCIKDGLQYFNKKSHNEMSLNGLKNLFSEVIEELQKSKGEYTALAIASPGVINSGNGVVIGSTPNLPYLRDVSLKEILTEISGLPVYVENDANLMTLAESQECDTKSVLGITIGTGIGTGFVIEKEIFNGENFRSMEAGHMIVVPNGRKCLCGKKGCFEAYCSSESMKRIISEKFPDTKGHNIFKLLNNDDKKIKKEILKCLDIFAVAVSNMIMILNPGTVVIGGGVIEIEAFDFDYLSKKVFSLLTSEFKGCIMKKALYGNRAGVMGAMVYGEIKGHLQSLKNSRNGNRD